MSLYDVLKVPKRATKAEIESAYRSLARIYFSHSKPASSDFVEINKAYTVLKDKHKRAFYDRFGDPSAEILLHNKDSYILTRILDGPNIYLYAAALGLSLCTLLALPPLVAARDCHGLSYTSMMLPFGISALIAIVPVIRSLFAVYGVYGMGMELRTLMFSTVNVLIMVLNTFNCTTYFDGLSNLVVSFLMLAVLQGTSLMNSMYYQMATSENLIVSNRRQMLLAKAVTFLLLTLLLSPIPAFTKPLLCLLQMVSWFCSLQRPVIVNLCVLVPSVLYLSTFSMVLAGVKSTLAYLPLGVLVLLVAMNLGYGISLVVRNAPRSKYDQKQMLALTHQECV